MTRNWLIITIFLLSFGMQAQFSELGVFAGGTNFLGDVGNQGLHLPQGGVVGVNFRHQFNTHYSLRFMGNFGQLANNDALSSWAQKKDRNQQFRASIWEVGAIVEINFLEFITGSRKMNHSPYLFGGISIFGFNPQGKYLDGEWYDLQPLGTEGQGTSQNATGKYGLNGISVPFGMGYRWSLGNNFSCAIECGFRASSTDYLDDTSGKYANTQQLETEAGAISAYFADRSISDTDKTGYHRGNPANNDWYVFTGFHIYVALTPKNERCNRF